MIDRGPIDHHLKILPEYFSEVRAGKKTAEIRFDDRDFRVGDRLVLKEWKPRKKVFTGHVEERRVVGMTRLFRVIPGVESEWVMLHMKKEL